MKNLINKVFIGILTGLGIGYLSTIIVSIIINKGIYYPVANYLVEVPIDVIVRNAIGMAILGVIGSVSSEIYNIEKLSLLTKSIIQFVLIISGVLILGIYVGWIKSIFDALGTFILASIIFIVIWIVLYFGIKQEINAINEKLKEKK